MSNKFHVRVCSDLDYEEMVADISYENHFIAIVSQEKGMDNMEIEILFAENAKNKMAFLLEDFIEAITVAKKSLIKMQRS